MRFIPSIVAAAIALGGGMAYRAARRQGITGRKRTVRLALFLFGLWLLVGCVLTLAFGAPPAAEFGIEVIPPRADFTIGSYQPSATMVVGWCVSAGLILFALLLRIFFIPRLCDRPGAFQNAIEIVVETVENYTTGQSVDLGRPMFGYIFAVGATLLGNVIAELMGFRSPSSDLMFTLALALTVFLMANWYGLRRLSVAGRVKNLAHPAPLLLPIRIVTDLVNPFSMACRLFGNTVSGMIVMSLIYTALGNFASGIPSVVGLYFNVFAAAVQTIIFITLALASIREATTMPSLTD